MSREFNIAPAAHPTFTDFIIASLQRLHGHVFGLTVNYLFAVSAFQDLLTMLTVRLMQDNGGRLIGDRFKMKVHSAARTIVDWWSATLFTVSKKKKNPSSSGTRNWNSFSENVLCALFMRDENFTKLWKARKYVVLDARVRVRNVYTWWLVTRLNRFSVLDGHALSRWTTAGIIRAGSAFCTAGFTAGILRAESKRVKPRAIHRGAVIVPSRVTYVAVFSLWKMH